MAAPSRRGGLGPHDANRANDADGTIPGATITSISGEVLTLLRQVGVAHKTYSN